MYQDLCELIRYSRSSREYFLSLPVEMQMRLHRHNADIRSAAELHRAVEGLKTLSRQISLGGWNPD